MHSRRPSDSYVFHGTVHPHELYGGEIPAGAPTTPIGYEARCTLIPNTVESSDRNDDDAIRESYERELQEMHDNPEEWEASIDRVAKYAFCRIAEAWQLSSSEASQLIDMSEKDYGLLEASAQPESDPESSESKKLKQSQLLRVSAIIGIYVSLHTGLNTEFANSWAKQSNTGPLFRCQKPLEVMIDGGLPAIIEIRSHLEAIEIGL